MRDENKSNEIGSMLKALLKERSLSMRKFSELTGVDTAVISKIINGKRKATPDHLQKFADHLGVSISALYKAAGYPVDQKQSDLYTSIDHIQALLASTHLVDKEFRIEDVKQELVKYEQFSQTEEGTETILTKFEEKLKKVGSMGPFISQIKEIYKGFSQRRGTKVELALMGGVLLYFISTVDCIPDYLFPVGYIDDALVIGWIMNGLSLSK
ncbi:helix-turn-helix domain-containing protein [Pseudobacillus sp. FSL P4-0506]|uniref:helix-turn-helix domain-containing protein n=1 Tax=unclassified Pseudobacillus TaxID=2619284 RepID=UPI0030F68540